MITSEYINFDLSKLSLKELQYQESKIRKHIKDYHTKPIKPTTTNKQLKSELELAKQINIEIFTRTKTIIKLKPYRKKKYKQRSKSKKRFKDLLAQIPCAELRERLTKILKEKQLI